MMMMMMMMMMTNLLTTSPTGYGWTLDDPLRGETDDAAELDTGTAAAWASKTLSLGNSNASARSEDSIMC